jgi:ABC-type transporter Mla MlaB component
VLKITEVAHDQSGRTFKLEGKLLSPWVDALHGVCLPPLQKAEQVRLDLAAVTFVDAAGAKLLRELIRNGVVITRSSGFVAEILNTEEK